MNINGMNCAKVTLASTVRKYNEVPPPVTNVSGSSIRFDYFEPRPSHSLANMRTITFFWNHFARVMFGSNSGIPGFISKTVGMSYSLGLASQIAWTLRPDFNSVQFIDHQYLLFLKSALTSHTSVMACGRVSVYTDCILGQVVTPPMYWTQLCQASSEASTVGCHYLQVDYH